MLEEFQGAATIEKVASLCRRRAFVFPSSDIYGGLGSSFDYGHYGVLLKQNVKAEWQRSMVQERDDIVAARLGDHPPPGGLGRVRPRRRLLGPARRLPHLQAAFPRRPARARAPAASGRRSSPARPPTATSPRRAQFNLMFETFVGPGRRTSARAAFLRPETAQGIFVNFKNVTSSMRVKPPFGIAQIGKSFRNEITPGNFLFRMREFEQMEMEFFVPPAEAEEWHHYWIEERRRWYLDLGCASPPARARRTTPTSSRTTRAPRATSSTCSRSAGRSSRGSRTAATTTSASTPSTPGRSSSGSATRSATCRT